MNYKQKYLDHYNLTTADFLYCEYSWIVKRVAIKAENIHHVFFGANKTDDIENLMAVSYDVHCDAHNEKLDRQHLKDIHLEFMLNNPY